MGKHSKEYYLRDVSKETVKNISESGKQKSVSFKIPEIIFKRFQAYCLWHDIQKSDFCAAAFDEYLKEREEK